METTTAIDSQHIINYLYFIRAALCLVNDELFLEFSVEDEDA